MDSIIAPPPGANPGHDRAQDRNCDTDRRGRMVRQNIASIILLLAIVLAGALLITSLRSSMKMQACVESGRRDCARIDFDR